MSSEDRKVAIVTGGGRGIGLATALALARDGMNIVIADISESSAMKAAKTVTGLGVDAMPLVVDIGEVEQVEAMAKQIKSRYGRADILVNNAADLKSARLGDNDILDTSFEVWDQTYRVNLRGTVAVCKSVLPLMIERQSGAIVNICSVQAHAGDVVRIAYSATKAALVLVTKSIATSYGKQGIRCNGICPGVTQSRRLPEDYLQVQLDNMLTNEAGTPEDIAAAIRFLSSDEARYITGEILNVDGGLMAHLPWHASYNAQPDISMR